MAAVVLVAAFIKGAIGFGFPALGTPLLSLVVDVKTAVVVLILPNIVMDGIQFARRGAPLAIVRRFGVLLLAGALGVVLGTHVLVLLSPRAATPSQDRRPDRTTPVVARGVRREPWRSPRAAGGGAGAVPSGRSPAGTCPTKPLCTA